MDMGWNLVRSVKGFIDLWGKKRGNALLGIARVGI